jgi:predicted  nucleic acid-binding Zn-ribbon protein
MRKNIFIILAWVFIIGVFSGPRLFAQETGDNPGTDYVVQLGDDASMNWTKQVIRVKGNGFGPENIKELGRRKILAKRAAQMDAYRNLLEVVKGVHITSNTKVEDMMLASDEIKSRTEGMLKGMRVVDAAYNDDGGCEITVEVNINEKGQFLLSALNTGELKVKVDNYPKFDWVILRQEWERTKEELARTKTTLDKTEESLQNTRYELANMQEELKQVKTQYAVLRKDFDQTRDQLLTSNLNLHRTELKLKHANLREDELKALFNTTKKELKNTKSIVNRLQDILDNDIFELAVEDKELFRTQAYLSQDKKAVNQLWEEFEALEDNNKSVIPSPEAMQGYVQRMKEIQRQTGGKLSQFYETPASPPLPPLSTGNYTGLLIDARGLPIKPVLAPSILTEKEEKVYGLGVVPATLTAGATADYLSGELDRAKNHEKIGDQPLVIKAMKVANENDVIISDADMKKLASIYELLEQQKVAILI